MDEPRHMYLFVERDQLQAKRNTLPGRCGLRIYSPRAANLGPVLHPGLGPLPLARACLSALFRLCFYSFG